MRQKLVSLPLSTHTASSVNGTCTHTPSYSRGSQEVVQVGRGEGEGDGAQAHTRPRQALDRPSLEVVVAVGDEGHLLHHSGQHLLTDLHKHLGNKTKWRRRGNGGGGSDTRERRGGWTHAKAHTREQAQTPCKKGCRQQTVTTAKGEGCRTNTCGGGMEGRDPLAECRAKRRQWARTSTKGSEMCSKQRWGGGALHWNEAPL
jgi:hypothetical protein